MAYGGSLGLQEERAEQQADWASRGGENVADTQRNRLRKDCNQSGSHIQWDNQAPEQIRGTEPCQTGCSGSYVSNADCIRLEKQRVQGLPEESGVPVADDGWWPVEPDVGRVANGVPHRVDRLKCLGNAVVPQQFYPIFRAIAEVEEMYG